MNREEAVKKIAREGYISIEHAEELYDSIVPKPVVPQYVADWYEENKGDLNGALFTTVRLWDEKIRNSDFYRWFTKNKEAIQTLVNMHQFGYEVEKEIRYTVRFKGLSHENVYLNKHLFRNSWFIEEAGFGCEDIYHTRKELEEAGFGWVFDCEGIEIEEVE